MALSVEAADQRDRPLPVAGFKGRKPKLAEELTLPVASGVVAGGSLMGVVLVLWVNGGSILDELLGV